MALDPKGDREHAFRAIPEDRRVMDQFGREVLEDYTDLNKECAAGLLPLAAILNPSRLFPWGWAFAAISAENKRLWEALLTNVLTPIQQYQIPVIQLRRSVGKAAVCKVFEKVNTGGVDLDVFELLTAMFAAKNFRLRPDWHAREKRLHQQPLLRATAKTDFLQAITLLTTYERRQNAIAANTAADQVPGVSCKKEDVLTMALTDYQKWADTVEEGFRQAAKLLYGQYLFAARDVPYRTQLTPLAAVFAVLGTQGELAGVRARLSQWYWCGVLGELYGGAIETRFARDLVEVVAWIKGGVEPSTVADASFTPQRLLTLRTRNSAAYKGVSALLMRDGARDFRTDEPLRAQLYFDDKVDIHHIFPQAWCKTGGIDAGRMNSIVNKTPISAKTNRIIGGNAPSVYLPKLEHSAGLNAVALDAILSTHVVDAERLRSDDFEAFFHRRASALLIRIEQAMGKPIAIGPAITDEVQDDDEDTGGEEAVSESV